MGRYAKNRELTSGSYSIRLPMGTNSIGPNAPVTGLVRYNQTRDRPEYFALNQWRGIASNEIDVPYKDTFYGDGTQTVFGPMAYPYPAGNEIFLLVFIHNVFQNPGVAFTVNGATITFSSPPPSTHPVVIIHGAVNGQAFTPLAVVPPLPSPTPTPTPTVTPTPSPTPTVTPTPTPTGCTRTLPVSTTAWVNGTFETTTPVSESAGIVTIPGWKIYQFVTRLNGLGTILSCITPNVDSSAVTGTSSGDDGSAIVLFNYGFESGTVAGQGGVSTLYLYSIGSVTTAFAKMRGPYVVSESYVTVAAGDVVSFNWRAENKSYSFYVAENYEVFAYLLDECTCQTIVLASLSGTSAPWTTVNYTIRPQDVGTYRFVFVAGSRDTSGGKAVGSQIYLDNVRVTKA